MPTLSSRRTPWPWDLRLSETPQGSPGGRVSDFRDVPISGLRTHTIGSLRPKKRSAGASHGFMLIPQDATGLIVGKKQTNLTNIYPPEAEYGSAPVYRERTFSFRPTGGMGERTQTSPTDHRFHYGMDVWVTGGLFGKGPLCHHLLPVGTGPIRRFAEGLNAARVLALFALAGSRIVEVAGDTNGTQNEIHRRVGQVATDAIRFQGAYATPVDGFYVAWDDGMLEEWGGGAWATCALPASFSANLLEKVGDELWAADSARSVIRKCTADPKVAGSWSGPILVGEPSAAITAIRQTNNTLVIFKADGDVFTVNSDGSDNDLFPGLKMPPSGDNGRTAVAWLNALWFRAGRAFFSLEMPAGTLTPVGPGRMLANASDVKGPVQAFAGWNTQMAFSVIYNSANNTSYLLNYGNWEPTATDAGTGFTFTDQYDGALAHWTNRMATALWITGAKTPDTRLYIGFQDGSYDWIKLVPFPLGPSSGGEFTTGPSEIILPLHHAMFQADRKHWTGFSLFGPSIEAGDVVALSYRVVASAGAPGATPAGGWIVLDDEFIHNGQRIEAPHGLSGIAIEIKLSLSSAAIDRTPVIEALGIHERLVPQFRRDFSMSINANDVVARRDGASVRQSGRQMRDQIMDAAAAPASIMVQLPDELLTDLAIFEYTERMVPHNQRGSQGWAVDISCTQFGTSEVYGIVRRLHGTSIGDLRGFQIEDLRVL